MSIVIIIMGSKSDLSWAERIAAGLTKLGVESVMRISSAHKTPEACLEIIREYEGGNAVFITVAGRSNALGGFVDAQTASPVITCPPSSDKFGGADIFSSLRMPSAVAPVLVLEPEGAALAAAKILGVRDSEIRERVRDLQQKAGSQLKKDDEEIKGG